MSSYFVNSFCGRYPNGPDYQLHNYGDHSSVSEQYRDSASMHSGRYGYGYNGMDLSVGRSASTHFGASERARTYPANSTSASTEPSSSTHISRDGVGTSSGTEEDTPASSEQASAPSDQSTAQPSQPQIYPWMRKLHISHGKASTLFFLYFSGGKAGLNVKPVSAPSKVGERGKEGVGARSPRSLHGSSPRRAAAPGPDPAPDRLAGSGGRREPFPERDRSRLCPSGGTLRRERRCRPYLCRRAESKRE
uniref:Homeobox A5 n=1 Tax=Pavo cristatus TaxID=9049 RepID=A0A8C9FKK3_PAVCR